MLILTRKLGESITIGDDIKVTLLDIKGKHVRIGIEAPRDIAVHREEVYQMIREQNIRSAVYDELGGQELSDIWGKLKKKVSKQEVDS